MSQLDHHYLADIGLMDEDLHLLSAGNLPERFKQVDVDKTGAADIRLVSSGTALAEGSQEVISDPRRFDKTA